MALLDGSLIALLEAVAAMARKGPGGHHGGGRRKSVLKGGNEEFADYRPYQPGDDFRRIDWKPWLRLGEAFTKVFARSTSGEVFVLLDTSASMGVPARKGLLAARLAAALGYLALCTGDRLTLEMLRQGSSAKLGPVEGKQNAGMLIATLEAARFEGACEIGRAHV